jgi:hypothetical protein
LPSINEFANKWVHDLWNRVQKAGFWWLILFMLGITTGFKVAEHQYASKFDDAIKLGGVIHKTIVYDVRLRP